MECTSPHHVHPVNSADPPTTSGFTPLSLREQCFTNSDCTAAQHSAAVLSTGFGGRGEGGVVGANLPVLGGRSGLFLLVIYGALQPEQHQGSGQPAEAIVSLDKPLSLSETCFLCLKISPNLEHL